MASHLAGPEEGLVCWSGHGKRGTFSTQTAKTPDPLSVGVAT